MLSKYSIAEDMPYKEFHGNTERRRSGKNASIGIRSVWWETVWSPFFRSDPPVARRRPCLPAEQ